MVPGTSVSLTVVLGTEETVDPVVVSVFTDLSEASVEDTSAEGVTAVDNTVDVTLDAPSVLPGDAEELLSWGNVGEFVDELSVPCVGDSGVESEELLLEFGMEEVSRLVVKLGYSSVLLCSW